MSAPVTERTARVTRARATTIPAQRPARSSETPATTTRRSDRAGAAGTGAAGKAYAKRNERLRRLVGSAVGSAVGEKVVRTVSPPGRAQFVLLVMALLASALVATLWLSTAATADSYQLKDARDNARSLREQSEKLQREVAAMQSAPELARRASELGMVRVQDPARLVVAPDGSVTVIGEPRAASHPAPPAQRSAPPVQDPAAQAPPAQDPAAVQPPAVQDPAVQAAAEPERGERAATNGNGAGDGAAGQGQPDANQAQPAAPVGGPAGAGPG
ncbi:hypothetical protein [Pseudonocardia sp. TRM90224]|uniref:hypothetical protein n=1 Tax=Pseudonocardia sp. TRM90224 TaxID=2812678 RepID=UPI001E63C61C|nr:hypothetical protein [Pseudonocardia sp. TRM90224]